MKRLSKIFILFLCIGLFSCHSKQHAVENTKSEYMTPPPETPKDLFFDYKCTDCHRMRGHLVGPSLIEISKKYKDIPNAKDILLQSILKGSKGKWPDDYDHWPMPPQRLPKKDAVKIVDWILHLNNKNN